MSADAIDELARGRTYYRIANPIEARAVEAKHRAYVLSGSWATIGILSKDEIAAVDKAEADRHEEAARLARIDELARWTGRRHALILAREARDRAGMPVVDIDAQIVLVDEQITEAL